MVNAREAGLSPLLCQFPRLLESVGIVMTLKKANSTVARRSQRNHVGGREKKGSCQQEDEAAS